MNTDVTRREFLATVAAAQGAFVLGFWMPEKAHAQTRTPSSTPPGAAWYEEPATSEVNAWIVVAPDDTVTIRIAQTELGQGVWTSNAMMVCEELQCDWTKVRPQYASANRDARENAPAWTLAVPGNGATDPRSGGVPTFGTRDRTGVAGIPDSLYRRMRTNAASSVKTAAIPAVAGAEARERLLLAARCCGTCPVASYGQKHHQARRSGPHVTYGQVAHPPRRRRIRTPTIPSNRRTSGPSSERSRRTSTCRTRYGAPST